MPANAGMMMKFSHQAWLTKSWDTVKTDAAPDRTIALRRIPRRIMGCQQVATWSRELCGRTHSEASMDNGCLTGHPLPNCASDEEVANNGPASIPRFRRYQRNAGMTFPSQNTTVKIHNPQ